MFSTDQKMNGEGLSDVSRALLAIREEVFDQWEAQVRANVDGACEVLSPILVNTLPAFYGNLAEALTPSYPRENATSHNSAAAAHGSERARMTNFGPDQVIHEYHLFKDALKRVSAKNDVVISSADWDVIERSINSAVREAVREYTVVSEELRNKLAAALSHDMRTPLAVISNGAQLINVAPDLAYAQRVAKKIESNANRLADMIADVLDALTTKPSETLPLSLSHFDMADLVKVIQQDFSERVIPSIHVVASAIQGYWCYGTMRRAVENLVTNAANYGTGESITIQLSHTRGRVMISVHNSGNPLAADQLQRIFEYAKRGGHPLVKGWGIGLPFVKCAAEDHGGSVTVDSASATGTTFLIDVPVDCRPFVQPV